MDRLVFLSTAALGVAFLLLYGLRCWRRNEQLDVGVLVNVVLQSGGVIAGAFLILSTIVPELKAQLATLDIYIFISGLAVFVVSAQGLKRYIGSPQRISPAPSPAVLPPASPVAVPALDRVTDSLKP